MAQAVQVIVAFALRAGQVVTVAPIRALQTERSGWGDDELALPAGSWHNVVNIGDTVLKVYSLYGPPDHVHGTRHATKQDADADPSEQH